jgi:fructose-1,6-bisphosphatase/inositol monophosphatase family enzyme
MSLAHAVPMRICLDFVWEAKRAFTEALYHHQSLQQGLGRPTETKEVGHMQYQYDVVGHELLLRRLRETGVNAQVFSEESAVGWIRVGSGAEHVIIVDPFDQSGTTARAFRMAAVALCVADESLHFQACAIGDLNTHLVYAADRNGAYVSTMDLRSDARIEELKWYPVEPSPVQRLSEAFLVSPGAKGKRREYVRRSVVTDRAGSWLNVDGVLNLARLAAGHIDAYLDPCVGQPIYEIVCAALVQKAGGVVTDADGVSFDLSRLLAVLREDPQRRYPIVATCTALLHAEILDLLAVDREAGLLSSRPGAL